MNDPARPRVSKPVLILWGTVGLLVALGCGSPAKVSSTPSGTGVAATAPVTSPDTAAPKVMPNVKGKQLDVAKSDIKSAGFTDKVEVIGGGVAGVVVDANWKVCAQSPEAGQAITAAPKLTVDRTCGSGATESTTAPTTTAPAPSEPSTTSTTEPEKNLTAATNADLAALLTGRHDCDDTVQQFASMYRGKTIEFDGNIVYMELHGDKKTRYDVLVNGGNYGERYNGPNFKFEDVGIIDLHLTGPNVPERIGKGNNVHIVAKVEEFNRTQCLFFLDPVTTEVK